MTAGNTCWHCRKPLKRNANGGMYFVTYRTLKGASVRVHQACEAAAKAKDTRNYYFYDPKQSTDGAGSSGDDN